MAKHAHPGFLLHHAFHRVGEELFIVNGPNTSDAALRAATFALEQAAGLAYIALARFIDNHAPENERASLHAKVNEMGRVRAELRASSILRWPGGDPFPGQWRRVKGKTPRK